MNTDDFARIEFLEAEAWSQRLDALSEADKLALGSRVRRFGQAVALATPRADVAVINRAFALGWERPLDGELLAAVNDFFRDAGVPRWIVELSPHAPVVGGRETLITQGGVQRLPTVKLRGELSDANPGNSRSVPAVREIGPEDAGVFCKIVAPGFAIPEIAEPDLVSTLGHPDWHYYMAFDGERPIAGAAMFVQGDGAWFGVAGTLADARRRGGQTALLARRLADAKRLGCTWVTAETGPDTIEQPNPSYHNMLRAGLRVAYMREKYVFEQPSGRDAPEN